MQSGSSSRSGRNWGASVEEDAIREQQLKRTQSGSSLNGNLVEQQLKRTQSGIGAAAEADTIGEQQLCTESCPAPDYSLIGKRGVSS